MHAHQRVHRYRSTSLHSQERCEAQCRVEIPRAVWKTRSSSNRMANGDDPCVSLPRIRAIALSARQVLL